MKNSIHNGEYQIFLNTRGQELWAKQLPSFCHIKAMSNLSLWMIYEWHFQRQICPIPFIERDLMKKLFPGANYMFKVNNRNTWRRCEICSKLTIKTLERRNWRRSGVFIVNFEHTSPLVLVFLLLTLNM